MAVQECAGLGILADVTKGMQSEKYICGNRHVGRWRKEYVGRYIDECRNREIRDITGITIHVSVEIYLVIAIYAEKSLNIFVYIQV